MSTLSSIPIRERDGVPKARLLQYISAKVPKRRNLNAATRPLRACCDETDCHPFFVWHAHMKKGPLVVHRVGTMKWHVRRKTQIAAFSRVSMISGRNLMAFT